MMHELLSQLNQIEGQPKKPDDPCPNNILFSPCGYKKFTFRTGGGGSGPSSVTVLAAENAEQLQQLYKEVLIEKARGTEIGFGYPSTYGKGAIRYGATSHPEEAVINRIVSRLSQVRGGLGQLISPVRDLGELSAIE